VTEEKDVAEKTVTGFFDSVAGWLKGFGFSLSETMFAWTFAQLALIALAWLMAALLARILDKPIEAQMRNIHGNRAVLRVLVLRSCQWPLACLCCGRSCVRY